MPFDFWPRRPHRSVGGRSAAYKRTDEDDEQGHQHGLGLSRGDPSQLFVPHVDPEDEELLVTTTTTARLAAGHPHGGPGHEQRLDDSALAAFIADQARRAGVELLQHAHSGHHVSFPTEAARKVSELLAQLDPKNPDDSKKAAEELYMLRGRLDQRVRAATEPGPSNLQRSVALYRHLRGVFDEVGGERVVDQDVVWPVPGGNDPTPRTAGLDLETFYGLRPAQAPIAEKTRQALGKDRHNRSDGDLILRHSLHALFEELETLRNRTGGAIVNLHDDWRMWLAWLHTRNPILCIGSMGPYLARPDGERIKSCEEPAEIESDRAQRVFLLVGYDVECDPQDFRKVLRDIANGSRFKGDVPVRYRLRNPWNPSWGDRGHAWIKHRDFSWHFAEGFALLLPNILPNI